METLYWCPRRGGWCTMRIEQEGDKLIRGVIVETGEEKWFGDRHEHAARIQRQGKGAQVSRDHAFEASPLLSAACRSGRKILVGRNFCARSKIQALVQKSRGRVFLGIAHKSRIVFRNYYPLGSNFKLGAKVLTSHFQTLNHKSKMFALTGGIFPPCQNPRRQMQ